MNQRKVINRYCFLAIFSATLFGALALLPAAAQAYTYVPADPPRPCDPTVARCDVELEVVNDRGIPQSAGLILAADAADRNFYGDQFAAPLDIYVKRGVLAFNFNTGSFAAPCTDGWGGSCGSYRFPPPPGINFSSGQGFRAHSYPLQPGTGVYISRNSYWEGKMNDSNLFPEKLGQSWTVPAAGYRGRIVLPSFGTPRNPELAPRERGVLGLLNDLRVKNGAGRLTAQPDLNAAADSYACWLRDFLQGPNAPEPGFNVEILHYAFGDPQMRARDAGWSRRSLVSENLSIWGASPETHYQAWLNSSRHYQNMLDPKQLYVGLAVNCGVAVLKLAQELRSGADGPWGGWGDDVGDSSLAQWDEGWGDEPQHPGSGRKKEFQPKIRFNQRRQRLVVKVNSGARGRLTVRAGRYYRRTFQSQLKTPVSGRVVRIAFRASKKSAVASGTVRRCLKKNDSGKIRLRRCQR